tara:strand:- start:193 stop:393 length:201 start_codon:yes stop_codon:yes gene_type:complete
MTGDKMYELVDNLTKLDIKSEFNLEQYYSKMETIIRDSLLRPEKNDLTYDILDTEKSKKFRVLVPS